MTRHPNRISLGAMVLVVACLGLPVAGPHVTPLRAAQPAGGRPACADTVEAGIIQGVGYRIDTPHLFACKPMPDSPGTLVVALSFARPGPDGTVDPDAAQYDLDVLLVDAADLRGLARLHEDRATESDAWRFESLGIDTARYRLAPGVRAFGVTIGYNGSSRVNPAGDTQLRLYVARGGRITEVLRDLPVDESRGEWDTTCAGTFTRTVRTIDVDSQSHQGFADLVVTARTTESRSVLKGKECVTSDRKSVAQPERWTYDGRRYRKAP